MKALAFALLLVAASAVAAEGFKARGFILPDGAVTATFPTPLTVGEGIEVRIPADGIPAALAVVHELAAPTRVDGAAPTLRRLGHAQQCRRLGLRQLLIEQQVERLAELRGQLRIGWGRTEWSAPWSVRR